MAEQSHIRALSEHLSRPVVGAVLLSAAIFALTAASILEFFGLHVDGLGPLAFVGGMILIQFGLFAFWPVITRSGREASTAIQMAVEGAWDDAVKTMKQARGPNRRSEPNNMALWDRHDPRLDLSLFSASVPTFVVNHEQKILDWNPAFGLVFRDCREIKRGAHISTWFNQLDNFKRVSVRQQKLYGEGILPLADRERATFLSARFGRMVFTKIMNPIVDRGSGRTIGWTVVLNVNSVNKRKEFLDELYNKIETRTQKVRYSASYNGIFENYRGYQDLGQRHLQALQALAKGSRIIELGAGTGLMTRTLLQDGYRVTAVEHDVELLRKIKNDCAIYAKVLKLVKQDPDDLRQVPSEKFDAAVMHQMVFRLDDPEECLKEVYRALKPGGVLTLSSILPSGGWGQLFHAVRRELEEKNLYDNIKYQFSCVQSYEQARGPQRFPSREDLRAHLLAAGFAIEAECNGLVDGHTIQLIAKKPKIG